MSKPEIYLLIVKDPDDRRRALEKVLKKSTDPLVKIEPESFTEQAFFQEVETLPMLSKSKRLLVEGVDQLNQEQRDAIAKYISKPNAFLTLILTAASLASNSKFVKAVQEKGKVFRAEAEKPWEKEKKTANWLVQRAQERGVRLTLPVATTLVQAVHPSELEQELDKLICFVGSQQEITLDAIHQISTPIHHETLWQMADAIFERSTAKAIQVGHVLLAEGMSIFPLLATLRSQFQTAQTALSLLEQEGTAAVTKKFPYLKGRLLDKKLILFRRFGSKRLVSGLILLFQSELEAKNSQVDPQLFIELLLAKLTNDALSTA